MKSEIKKIKLLQQSKNGLDLILNLNSI